MTRAPADRERLAALLGAARVVPIGVSASGPIELLGIAQRGGALRSGHSLMRPQAPMIHDAFFEGLMDPTKWIERVDEAT